MSYGVDHILLEAQGGQWGVDTAVSRSAEQTLIGQQGRKDFHVVITVQRDGRQNARYCVGNGSTSTWSAELNNDAAVIRCIHWTGCVQHPDILWKVFGVLSRCLTDDLALFHLTVTSIQNKVNTLGRVVTGESELVLAVAHVRRPRLGFLMYLQPRVLHVGRFAK